jgi:hypothetical protein
MRHVRAEAGEQALERLILVAEEDEFGAAAMVSTKGWWKAGSSKPE